MLINIESEGNKIRYTRAFVQNKIKYNKITEFGVNPPTAVSSANPNGSGIGI